MPDGWTDIRVGRNSDVDVGVAQIFVQKFNFSDDLSRYGEHIIYKMESIKFVNA